MAVAVILRTVDRGLCLSASVHGRTGIERALRSACKLTAEGKDLGSALRLLARGRFMPTRLGRAMTRLAAATSLGYGRTSGCGAVRDGCPVAGPNEAIGDGPSAG
jgi:hypothetical protein